MIPLIMFTVVCCAKKKIKADSKVVFTKSNEGTFKVIIIPTNEPADDTIKDCDIDVLKQNQSSIAEATTSTLSSDTIIVPNSDEIHVRQLSKSPVMPKRNIQSKQATIGSDIIISPNPSYNVVESNEEKFTLSESLYIYCGEPSADEEENISEKQAVNDGRKDKALHGADDVMMDLARSTSYDDREPQTFEDSMQQTVAAAREECDNALYEVTEYHNASYEYIPGDINIYEDTTQHIVNDGRQECDNALYEARECDSASLTGDDVTLHCNPSYSMTHTVSKELTFENSYEYIATQTYEDTMQQSDGRKECDNALYKARESFEDFTQQIVNDGRKECNNALYEAREHENVSDDVPSNPDPKRALTRSTSQNSYDYIYETYDDDTTHHYSMIDSIELPNHRQLTTEDNTDAVYVNSNVTNRGCERIPHINIMSQCMFADHRPAGNI